MKNNLLDFCQFRKFRLRKKNVEVIKAKNKVLSQEI